MDTPEKRKQLESLAEEMLELVKLASMARAQTRKGDHVETLTETETLAMDALSKRNVLTVGEIQKSVGVLPAQMSRVIRSLEDKAGGAYIECRINPRDRRKVDVTMTPAGRKALETYRTERLGMAMEVLAVLTPAEREEYMRLLRKIRGHIAALLKRRPGGNNPPGPGAKTASESH